jgi:predicted Fe-S protein YdhL (DUF1289 family)
MQTPCIRICIIDPVSQLCRGCARTLGEIGDWSSYDDSRRSEIITLLPLRLETLPPLPEYSAE